MDTYGDLAYCLIGIGSACWAIGGWRPKWVRRYLWPALAGGMAYMYGVHDARLIFVLLLAGSCTMGYGENHPLWRKIITLLALGACLLPLGQSWGLLSIPIVFGVLYLISRKGKLTWKVVESIVGGMQGYWIATFLMKG